MGKLIEYLLIRLGLFFFFFAVTWPFPLTVGYTAQYCRKHDLDWISWILALIGIGWFLWLGWMVEHTATRMVFERKSFLTATKDSIYEMRFYLSFVPLIGWLFGCRRDDETTKQNKELETLQ